MRILGISGIHGTVEAKRAAWPGRDEREYRISQGHDSAAALVIDGEVVAAVAEERVNRRKHTGEFPAGAIASCLELAAIDVSDIDELAHAFDFGAYKAAYLLDPDAAELWRGLYSREALLRQVAHALPEFPHERVVHVDHHLAHAASAYFTSGWEECLVIIVDGMGEIYSLSVYHGRDGALQRLHTVSAADSIGILYGLVTLHLGFDFNADEYKIMGLAPYGDPTRFAAFFDGQVLVDEAGSVHVPLLRLNRTREEREFHLASRRRLTDVVVPPRDPEAEIEAVHRDVAAALQDCLDRTMVDVCRRFAERTGLRRLALAGGVALNCTANGKLLQADLFDEIYVQPAAADDGSALGAALQRASLHGRLPLRRQRVPFLGPGYPSTAVDEAVAGYADAVHVTRFVSLDEAVDEAARLIDEGRVLAWYRGRMEFGPRALGHRSILADPGGADMRDRINAMVKMREAFRPFAPAVTVEQVDRWFDVPVGTELPYMIVTVDVRPEHRDALPAITHVNGSARVQTVSAEDDAAFHALLRAVGRRTGREMLLNTSFNVKGQPIVNTPAEAIETFLGTGIDDLFLENVLVRKR